MKSILILISALFACLITFSQDKPPRDLQYIMELERISSNLVCDTVVLASHVQSLTILCHLPGDTMVLKHQTISNYGSNTKGDAYVRTEYYNSQRKLLAWLHSSLESGDYLAGVLNYHDKMNRLVETFRWGSGELGIREFFFYNANGKLVKTKRFRGNRLIEEKRYN